MEKARSICGGAWVLLLFLLVSPANADSPLRPGVVRFEETQSLPAIPGDVADELRNDRDGEDPEKPELVIAPLPSRSPMLGWQVKVPAMLFYRPENAHPDDNSWLTGAGAFYAENESWGAGGFHRMSLGGDRWRVTATGFYGEINYDYFGIGGNLDQPVSLNQPSGLIMAEALRQVYPDLFVGLRASYTRTETRLNRTGALLPPDLNPADLVLNLDLTTVSPRLVYDTRDDEFYPRNGAYLNSKVDLASEALGSEREYERYDMQLNGYWSLSTTVVLATRVAVQHVAGDAPFYAIPAFGANNNLRGYQAGTYRDRFLFASQAEIRYRFHPRFGVVAFAGVGTVAPEFGGWDESLGSIGAGLRWVAAPKNNVSFRIDVARGRDDTELYFSIGEAF